MLLAITLTLALVLVPAFDAGAASFTPNTRICTMCIVCVHGRGRERVCGWEWSRDVYIITCYIQSTYGVPIAERSEASSEIDDCHVSFFA